MLHNVDRTLVDIRDIEEYTGNVNVSEAEFIIGDDFDEEGADEDKLQRIKDTRIDTLGLYMDTDKMEITLMALPQQYMQFIQQRVNREKKGYQVIFKDSLGILDSNKKGALYVTQSWLSSETINMIQQLYLQYFKSMK